MIFITGFEAFGGFTENTSQSMVRSFQKQSPFLPEFSVETALLPVEQEHCFEVLLPYLVTHSISHIFLLGMAAHTKCLSVEKTALNWANYTIPDNANRQPQDDWIEQGAPLAYFSTFPVIRMVQLSADTPIPVQLSLSAGSYVCNDLYYRTLHWAETNRYPAQIVFIHLPALSDSDNSDSNSLNGFSFTAVYETLLRLMLIGTGQF